MAAKELLLVVCLFGSFLPALGGIGMVGAPILLKDPKDQYAVRAAQFAVQELNKMSNSLMKLVLVKISDGTVQVCRCFGGNVYVCRNFRLKKMTLQQCKTFAH